MTTSNRAHKQKFYSIAYATLTYDGHEFDVRQCGFSEEKPVLGGPEAAYTLTHNSSMPGSGSHWRAKEDLEVVIRIWKSGRFDMGLLEFLSKSLGKAIKCTHEQDE